jgi:threonine dehydratase
MPGIITLADIHAAATRIAGTAVRTPLVRIDPARLAAFDLNPTAEIYLKDESKQPIGSFKLRGAFNKISQLTPDELSRGVITYSSGNHAQGVAYAARALGAKAVIVMPSNAPAIKRAATLALGAEVVTVGPASSERRLRAEELAAAHGYTVIPPYDDPAIIAGQATCGLEIVEQLVALEPAKTLVLSPVSGGGLLSGVATAVKLTGSNTKVYGCEPEVAADAKQSFDTKQLTEWPASQTSRTICDGLRTQSLGALNFEHILKFVDGIVTVSEAEILLATRIFLSATDIIAEPSGAITLTAALFHAHELPAAQRIVVIVSGGNLEPAIRDELETDRLSIAGS